MLEIEDIQSESPGTEMIRTILADTFVLYMKTYTVHWNFVGPDFFSIHKLTEIQYGELAGAIDEIAERLRAVHRTAPVSLDGILNSSDLLEFREKNEFTANVLGDLARGHRLISSRASEASKVLEEEGDAYGSDLMIRRIGDHDKASWMLMSYLEGKSTNGNSHKKI